MFHEVHGPHPQWLFHCAGTTSTGRVFWPPLNLPSSAPTCDARWSAGRGVCAVRCRRHRGRLLCQWSIHHVLLMPAGCGGAWRLRWPGGSDLRIGLLRPFLTNRLRIDGCQYGRTHKKLAAKDLGIARTKKKIRQLISLRSLGRILISSKWDCIHR